MKRIYSLAFVIALFGCDQQESGAPVQRIELGEPGPAVEPEDTTIASAEEPTVDSACTERVFEEIPLTHCVADPAQHRITTALGTMDAPHRSLEALSKGKNAESIAFAMNAGMFNEAGQPIGYYVEGGNRLKALNRAEGDGDFYSKPNGVFYGSGSTWRVLDSDSFYSNVRERPQFGTQSGPMLLIDGKLHPDIQDNGPSRNVRNAVGVGADGKAHFVISEAPISFGQLARFYRDELKVANALYLDGNISALWDPARERMDAGDQLGPFLLVEKR